MGWLHFACRLMLLVQYSSTSYNRHRALNIHNGRLFTIHRHDRLLPSDHRCSLPSLLAHPIQSRHYTSGHLHDLLQCRLDWLHHLHFHHIYSWYNSRYIKIFVNYQWWLELTFDLVFRRIVPCNQRKKKKDAEDY